MMANLRKDHEQRDSKESLCEFWIAVSRETGTSSMLNKIANLTRHGLVGSSTFIDRGNLKAIK